MNANFLLLPFSRIYGAVVGARQFFYEREWFASVDLGAPVVSVGNLTVGGTGKTPLVAFVARVLAAEGFKVCVLTRGYRRANANQRVLVSDGTQVLANVREAGDEPLMLAQKLLHTAAVIANKNRAAAGSWARENLGVTAFVLDDGFQHLRVGRDLNIVTIDATNPFGNGKLLPAGILREPLASLKRADVVVITRANLSEKSAQLKAKIEQINPHCPILFSTTRIAATINLNQFLELPAKAQSRKEENNKQQTTNNEQILAFCGLGNAESFFEQLRREGFQVLAIESFPDHYVYKQSDIASIERRARENGASVLLTTAKDAVKLREFKFDLPCFVVEIEPVFDHENVLKNLIKSKTNGKAF